LNNEYCNLTVKSEVIKGLGVSAGTAIGPVCLFEQGHLNNMPVFPLETQEDIARELQRFRQAKKETLQDIDKTHKDIEQTLGEKEASILYAHKVILSDEVIDEQIEKCLRDTMMNIEYCVVEIFEAYEDRIASIDNEYIRERGTDFSELKRRILKKLGSLDPGPVCREDACLAQGTLKIIIARELTPSLTVDLDRENIVGFVTEHGGKTSHAAILANALGIPAVTGIKGLHGRIPCGTILYVDGDRGEVWVNPSAEEQKSLAVRSRRTVEDEGIPEKIPGTSLKIYANVNDIQGANLSIEKKAEGAGLVRTEYLFFEASDLPDEEAQFRFYSGIVKAFKGRKVTFRMLDVGGDKPVPYLHLAFETNPYLGWRGTRFLLDNPEIVQTQVRAIARASEFGPVEIMYPMITDIHQLEEIRSLAQSVLQGKRGDQYDIREGLMVEVPSILFEIDQAAEMVDFFSIGTNDLIQYIFAVDRNNEHVASSYDSSHPVLWNIIEQVAQAGRHHNIPVTVCGEMAGNPEYTERFIQAGITGLSMSPIMIPDIKRALMKAVRTSEEAQRQVS